MIKRSDCGSGGCVTCPFSSNDEAFDVQNLGCLPSAYDIVQLKEKTNQNWSCHGDSTVLCGGFARYVSEKRPDLDVKTGGLINYDTYANHGEYVALLEAKGEITFNKPMEVK